MPAEARKLISKILVGGCVVFWKHAKEELKKDNLDTVDATNVLRAGQVNEPAENVRQRWRYRVHTKRMGVVVQFEDEATMTVVTAWRKKGK